MEHLLEHLARDELLQLGHQLAAQLVGVVAVRDDAQCICRLPVDLDLKLHQIVLTEARHLVLHGGVALQSAQGTADLGHECKSLCLCACLCMQFV